MKTAPTVFVQIASYRDPECQWTVRDLFFKADRPEFISVGICWQYDPCRDMDCFAAASPRPDQTRIISVLPRDSQGVCWARAQAQTLFDEQEYVLMIDSHMRFIKGWDTSLINELARCASPKSFLSTYPARYTPPNYLEPRPQFVILRATPFNEMGDIRFAGETLPVYPQKPLRGAFLAAGYIFAPGQFVREVPYDPYVYFNHEEVTLAARAYTNGWDVYSPSKTIIYHYYREPDKGDMRPLHWTDVKDWEKFLHRSRARYNYLLTGVVPENRGALADIELYGFGNARTIKDYEAFCGLDFKTKTASQKALQSGFIEDLDRCREAKVGKTPGEGDLLPSITLSDFTGNPHDITMLAAAKPSIICILPNAFDDYVREFIALYKANATIFYDAGVRVVFIAPVPVNKLAFFRLKYAIDTEIMADETQELCDAFGFRDTIHDSPLSCGIDRNNKITAIYRNRNAENHMGDILREAGKLKSMIEENENLLYPEITT